MVNHKQPGNGLTQTGDEMEDNKIKKLIEHHEWLLDEFDIQIGELTKQIRKARKAGDGNQADCFRQEKQIVNTKRQCSVQTIKDLEDIA